MECKKLNINIKSENIVPFRNSAYYVPVNSEIDMFTETQEIIFNLSMGKPIEIVFDEKMNSYLSRRILDFMCGILYAYNGSIIKNLQITLFFCHLK